MRKILLTVALALFAVAGFAAVMDGGYDGQVVITDCGTEYEIPADCDEEEAIVFLEEYSDMDCY